MWFVMSGKDAYHKNGEHLAIERRGRSFKASKYHLLCTE